MRRFGTPTRQSSRDSRSREAPCSAAHASCTGAEPPVNYLISIGTSMEAFQNAPRRVRLEHGREVSDPVWGTPATVGKPIGKVDDHAAVALPEGRRLGAHMQRPVPTSREHCLHTFPRHERISEAEAGVPKRARPPRRGRAWRGPSGRWRRAATRLRSPSTFLCTVVRARPPSRVSWQPAKRPQTTFRLISPTPPCTFTLSVTSDSP